jgi:hypothetical protein
MKTLKNFLFDRPRVRFSLVCRLFTTSQMKRVYDDPDDTERRILVLGDKVSDLDLSSLPSDLQEFVRANGGVPVRHVLRVGYDQLRVDEVLKKLLPLELSEVQTAYEQVSTLLSFSCSVDIARLDIWLT